MTITEEAVRKSSFHRYFHSIVFLLVSSSILVSITSSMLLMLSFILQEITIDVVLIGAVFALTFAVYNFDRSKKQKEDLINDPDRSSLLLDKGRRWALVGMVSFTASMTLGALKGIVILGTLFSPLLVYIGYGIGLPALPRLKDIPGIKNAVLVATWSLIPTLLPNLSKYEPIKEPGFLGAVFYFIFIKILINSILFDVRDVKGDKAANVKTLPVIFGVKSVRKYLLLLNATLILWTILCIRQEYFVQYLPLLVANILYGFWYIHFFTRKTNPKRILIDLFVDGEWIPLTLAIIGVSYYW